VPHIVEPDPPGAGCVDEAVEPACHRVGVRPLPVLPDEQPAARRVGGTECLPLDVEHGQMPPEGRDRESIQGHGPHSCLGLAIGLLGAASHRDKGLVDRERPGVEIE
jgi:hypothetical protein